MTEKSFIICQILIVIALLPNSGTDALSKIIEIFHYMHSHNGKIVLLSKIHTAVNLRCRKTKKILC